MAHSDSSCAHCASSPEPLFVGDHPLRILVVEDEALIAMDIELMVEELGGQSVGVVRTGAAAIVEAERLRPDVVLMDIQLADQIDGVQAAERIRAKSRMPIVFVSANNDHDTQRRIAALEAAFVSKPVLGQNLCNAILRAYGQ
jgi:CheY-like chemotaxis protein